MKNLNSSEEIIINKNELKVDLYLNDKQMVLCGTCLIQNENNEITGLSCVNILIFKDGKIIKSTVTNQDGHYLIKIPLSHYYIVYAYKNNYKIKKIVDCNYSLFCMQHFIFNKS